MLEAREIGRLHLDTLSRLVDAGVLLADPDGALEYASARAIELLGCADAADLGVRWTVLARVIEAALEDPSGPLECQAQPLGDEGVLYLLKDRRSLSRPDTDALLASRMRVLGDFQRQLAHDLRAPLNSLQLSLELLSATREEGTDERHMTVMREELSRLARCVEAALERDEPMGEAPEEFDLRDTLAEIARLLKPRSRSRRVAVDMDLPGSALRVNLPRDRVKQALLNVFLEFLQAQGEEGRVRIVAEARGTRIEVSVNGTCAPSARALEALGHIEPSALDAAGAGLHAARRLIAACGGDISAERGPRLTVSLPTAQGFR